MTATVTVTEPPHDHRAILFDVDGVLLDSQPRHEHVWRQWAQLRGLDAAAVLRAAHGRRPQDAVREVARDLDPAAESQTLNILSAHCRIEVAPFAGAASLLRSLPDSAWALVTSGSRRHVHQAFQRHRLPLPKVQVYGEDVTRSKPAPDGYLLAASRLRIAPDKCIVIEDSPAGIQAGKAAGCAVMAVGSTDAEHDPPPDLHAADLHAVKTKLQTWLAEG